jgi:hypothetical protein
MQSEVRSESFPVLRRDSRLREDRSVSRLRNGEVITQPMTASEHQAPDPCALRSTFRED